MRYFVVPEDRVHRLFYPVVATVVTSAHEGEVAAMLASSCMPISLKPPIIGVAVMTTHRTHRVIKSARSFAVCWISIESLEKLKKLGEKTPSGIKDKLSYAGFDAEKGRRLSSLPIPRDAVAWVECTLLWSKDIGDHELFAGKVEAAYAIDDFGEYWNYRNYKPVLYIGGRYATLSSVP